MAYQASEVKPPPPLPRTPWGFPPAIEAPIPNKIDIHLRELARCRPVYPACPSDLYPDYVPFFVGK